VPTIVTTREHMCLCACMCVCVYVCVCLDKGYISEESLKVERGTEPSYRGEKEKDVMY
jgi:hypothetical protein